MKLIQLLCLILILPTFNCKDTPKENVDLSSVSKADKPTNEVKEDYTFPTVEKVDTNASSVSLEKVNKIGGDEKKQIQKKKKPKKRAKIVFEETEYDFGVIDQGDKINHDFIFKNTGNADLEILNVEVTCGCTTPSYPFIPIAPGEKGTIGVSYNSTGKLGNQKPMITVFSNARPKVQKIYLKGIVDAARAKDKNVEIDAENNE